MTDAPPPPPPPGAAPEPAYPYGYGYGYGNPAVPTYSHWGKRVAAFLLDGVIQAVVSIPFYAGYFWLLSGISSTTDSAGNVTTEADVSPAAVVLTVVGGLAVLAFNIWNICIRQGRTGYTLGKGIVGIRLVKEQTGRPVGAGIAFVRQLAHIVDSLVCYLGWLWPLWDSKRQTLADKIMTTIVIDQPSDQAQ